MTPRSGVFSLVFAYFFAYVSVGLADSTGILRIEIVAGNANTGVREFALGRRGNSSVGYLRYARQSYNALTTIGPYAFLLSLDTASADTWVISSDCRTASCQALPTYPARLFSPSFTAISGNTTKFHVSFADGTAADGVAARETIGIGGFNLAGQTFGLVNSTNVTLASGGAESSGVLGLGFPRLSSIGKRIPGGVPPIARLAQQGNLSYPLFGLNLRKNNTGTLSLGAIDIAVATNLSMIAWHNVMPFPTLPTDNSSIYLHWAIPMSGISVGTQRVIISPTYPEAVGDEPIALLDIGTNGIFGPAADVAALFRMIPASRLVGGGQYAVPCDTTLNMSFTFGQNYTLHPQDYIYTRVADPPNMCLAWPQATAPSNDGIDWQLGTPFLRTVYSVFSYGINNKEPPKIGLYPLFTGAANSPEAVSHTLSADSATFATTLPNFLLPTPTYTTPPYLFSPTSSSQTSMALSSLRAPSTPRTTSTSEFEYQVPSRGQLEATGLGANTYSALVTRLNGALLPTGRAPYTVVTDSNGGQKTVPMPMQTTGLGGPETNFAWRCHMGMWELRTLVGLGFVLCMMIQGSI